MSLIESGSLGEFDKIPLELHRIVFLSIGDAKSLLCFFCVCRRWQELAFDEKFWEDLLIKYTDFDKNSLILQHKNYRWIFFSKQPFTSPKFTGIGQKVCETNNVVYEGDWVNGKLHGKGIGLWGTKDLYIGDWEKGQRSGQGTCIWNAGDSYTGAWSKNKRNGFGTLSWKSGAKYVGNFQDDARQGNGAYTWANGDHYEGDWSDSRRTGKGFIKWADGNSYDGDWIEGFQHGQGTYRWQDGDKFEGGWRDNTKHGKGKYTWGCGDQSEGEWENDAQVGEGKLIWQNGNTFFGEWIDGIHEIGEYMEKATGRVFRRTSHKDSGVKLEDCHLSLIKSIQEHKCTFLETGTVPYFQYLWKTKDIDSRTHGVCYTCRHHCVDQNDIKLLEPNTHHFGGNFYCDCGAGNLESPCRAMGNHNMLS